MAPLFGNKKEKDEEATTAVQNVDATPVTAEKSKKQPGTAKVQVRDIDRVLLQPRITEKATIGTGDNVYAFLVAPDANKRAIIEAMQHVYKVTPVKVHIVRIPKKTVRNRRTGIPGVKGGGKKAYVYLKKGESISVI